MKNKILLVLSLLLFIISSNCQCVPKVYEFRNPTVSSGVFKFSDIYSGIDAFISVLDTQNAVLDKIDDSSCCYTKAWQPIIKTIRYIPNAVDTSYVEFLIEFKDTSGSIDTQACLAMTIVGLDGVSVSRGMVKSTIPLTGKLNPVSTISLFKDSLWYMFKGGTYDYTVIDTSNLDCIVELDYKNVQKYKLRVGCIGQTWANTKWQFSFHFRQYDSMYIPLKINSKQDLYDSLEQEENIKYIFYDSTGQVFFTGKYSEFVLIQELKKLYFTNRGKKYIKIQN